jgi:hypothetical protein
VSIAGGTGRDPPASGASSTTASGITSVGAPSPRSGGLTFSEGSTNNGAGLLRPGGGPAGAVFTVGWSYLPPVWGSPSWSSTLTSEPIRSMMPLGNNCSV